MARRSRRRTAKKRPPKARPASRRKPAPATQRPSTVPVGPTSPALSPDLADTLDPDHSALVASSGAAPRVFAVNLPAAPAPRQRRGAPRKDGRAYAAAVTVDVLLDRRPTRLLTLLDIDPSRKSKAAAQFYAIL